ncbi:MAG: germination protein YpeB, partial [Alphaproteobacteria bacterium]|nr:germination protein YpeB [Alphaproteobacteria bacterium]
MTYVITNVEFSNYDYTTIEDLHTESLYLMTEYNNYVSGLKFNYRILSDVDFGDEDKSNFNAGLISSENSKVPTLIYDGPFSDSVLNKEIKGLGDNEIDSIAAKDVVLNKLNFLNIEDIEYKGEGSGDFYTYNFNIKVRDGRKFFVQVSKYGGEIVDLTGYGDGGNNSYEISECISIAEDFATKLGYEDMHQVWYAENGNIVYINLAPIKNKVIYFCLINKKGKKNGSKNIFCKTIRSKCKMVCY